MRALTLVTLATLTACSSGPMPAPYGATISWSETTLNTEVGLYCDSEPDYTGGLKMFDLLVLSDDDEPLERIEVEVEVTSVGGVYVLPQEAVKTVDLPAADADIETEGDIREACTDEDGNYDNTSEWCAWYWDEDNAQFYQFGEDYADADGYAPTYFIGETDYRGLLRAFVFLDCIYGDSTILANIGVANETLTISAEEESE